MKLISILIIAFLMLSCSEETNEIHVNEKLSVIDVFPAPALMTDDSFPIPSIQEQQKGPLNLALKGHSPEIKPAIFNGLEWQNTDVGIDVIFIMEGFTANEESKFYLKVNELIESMHQKEPFASNTSVFNFWTYNTHSEESGISIISHVSNPLTPVIKNTAWGVYRNRIGLARYTDLPKSKFKNLTQLLTHPVTGFFDGDVYSVFIVNDPVYAGSGEFRKPNNKVVNAIVTTSEQFSVATFKALFLHEFGHSFGDLDDEYQHKPTFDRIYRYEKQLMNLKRKLNTSEDNLLDRKWDHLVTNPQYILGTRWGNTEYRSSANSLMRSVVLEKPFDELNEILLQKRIDEAVGQ